MILFKSFVEAIYQAISEATDVLCEKNRQILDKYFYEYPNDDNGISEEKTLHPKTISLDYPVLNDEGTVVKCNIQVPLISLVPITATQIEKATFILLKTMSCLSIFRTLKGDGEKTRLSVSWKSLFLRRSRPRVCNKLFRHMKIH